MSAWNSLTIGDLLVMVIGWVFVVAVIIAMVGYGTGGDNDTED